MTKDTYGRTIDYLRVSVTDRCNFRCIYCMPEEGVESKEHDDILSLEEIGDFVRVAARNGIRHVRLTGGEPLVRLNVASLIRGINDIDGIETVSLTTNGVLLPRYADELREAGLTRVNISLDTLDPEEFRRVTRRGELADVLHAIDVALESGFEPVKINVVVVKSLNQDLFEFAKMTLDRPLHVRFIEYMPVGTSSGTTGTGWSDDEVIPSATVIETISRAGRAAGLGPLVAVDSSHAPGGLGPAEYFSFDGAQGTVGIISPLSHHFCGQCNRLRLTSDGKLRPCLFSDTQFDARPALKAHDMDAVQTVIDEALSAKPEKHEYQKGTQTQMSQIGG